MINLKKKVNIMEQEEDNIMPDQAQLSGRVSGKIEQRL